ncbi:peptide-N(4)-(N-acetyl-beta-glucosaminyl)asparagine amidase isoform X2 [Periplaneta americana]|uniref:peptide-N(4)-(N-acetyl-beta- glucosaminyl)asparagine amidase isoform X2 n=1 Tax=Periplaneta americana TaxID=6978 RepID=UPI0037E9320D
MTMSCVLALEENPKEVYLETTSLLLKLVDNIINNPTNPKYRSIRLDNPTVVNKLLSAVGAMECLFQMGFEEADDSLVLPPTVSIENLKLLRNEISARRSGYGKGAESRTAAQDLHKQIPQQPFLQRVRNDFAAVLRCEDKALQCKARALIPVRDLEIAAERSMRSLQKAVKSGQNKESDVDIQELVLLELLFWFKNSFFSWVDSPECSKCNGPTKFVGHRIIPDNGKQSYRNEMYVCELCQAQTLFPRYSDPEKLLETRRGRCGEWANCFMLMCRSLGWDTRCVVDETDHLWTEVYSGIRGRWLHCDPCENVCDAPLMYEAGWGKQLSYVMAYSRDEVQDVTWRYSSQHDRVLERRTACSEAELLATMMELRTARQRCLSAARRTHLTRRLLGELVEFLTPRQPTDNERKGRSSGSLAWRLARGEAGAEVHPQFVWKPTASEVAAGSLRVQYSCVLDRYVRVFGQEEIAGWQNGAFLVNSVFRKEEKDWKMAYLARREGCKEGSVTWRFDTAGSSMVVRDVRVVCSTWQYGTGCVQLKMCGADSCCVVIAGGSVFETSDFHGCSQLELTAHLTKGEGDNAWQHAQLFRQETSNHEDYALDITLTLKKM